MTQTSKRVEEIIDELDSAHRRYEETANYSAWKEDAGHILTQLKQQAVEKREREIRRMIEKRMENYADGRQKCGNSPEEQARAGRIEQREYALYEALQTLTTEDNQK